MHKKAFTPDNAAMLLIDHQLGTMGWTHSHDINLVKANAVKLARIAKALNMPAILTSSMEDQVQGPLMPELEQILPEAFAKRTKRPGIVNAMHHDGFNNAVKATGRKKLFVAGVTTEICVTFPVLQMLEEGYEVQVSADASASWSKYGDDLALRRMEDAGSSDYDGGHDHLGVSDRLDEPERPEAPGDSRIPLKTAQGEPQGGYRHV